MENRKYKISRNLIYIGEVGRANGIYACENGESVRTTLGKLCVGSWEHYRSMLFVHMTNDLLYRSPSYPILNMSDNSHFSTQEKFNGIIVKDAYPLAELLEAYEFDDLLTYDDVVDIRKTFFARNIASRHPELFGWKELTEKNINFPSYMTREEIKRAKQKLRQDRAEGGKTFCVDPESDIDPMYWKIADDRADQGLIDVILTGQRINEFKPHKEEGNIKKLPRL